jgi:hypothetical protein
MRIVLFGLAAFVVIFGGGLLGFLLSRRLPESVVSAQPMQQALAEISAP